MEIGKVPESVLKRAIFRQIRTKRREVLVGASVGEDCAAVQLAPDEVFVLSTDPITGATKDTGRLAVQITANDLASAGAEPVGILLTVLLPPSADEALIRQLMQERLPAAMRPTRFVRMSCMPITKNGKVDRDALLREGTECHE